MSTEYQTDEEIFEDCAKALRRVLPADFIRDMTPDSGYYLRLDYDALAKVVSAVNALREREEIPR